LQVVPVVFAFTFSSTLLNKRSAFLLGILSIWLHMAGLAAGRGWGSVGAGGAGSFSAVIG